MNASQLSTVSKVLFPQTLSKHHSFHRKSLKKHIPHQTKTVIGPRHRGQIKHANKQTNKKPQKEKKQLKFEKRRSCEGSAEERLPRGVPLTRVAAALTRSCVPDHAHTRTDTPSLLSHLFTPAPSCLLHAHVPPPSPSPPTHVDCIRS